MKRVCVRSIWRLEELSFVERNPCLCSDTRDNPHGFLQYKALNEDAHACQSDQCPGPDLDERDDEIAVDHSSFDSIGRLRAKRLSHSRNMESRLLWKIIVGL